MTKIPPQCGSCGGFGGRGHVCPRLEEDTVTDWISVNDRLPDFDIPVLGFCKIYGRSIRVYRRIGNTEYGTWDDVMNGLSGGFPPTHWMPLPNPPEDV